MAIDEINIGLPSAPSPGLILFNCEDQSDIIFSVTLNPPINQEDGLKCDSNKWRFPAHSFIIQESSPFFASLVQQLKNEKKSKPIVNINCQPELFHLLMSYIYKKEVKLNCSFKCLALFEIAIKFDLIDLAVVCLSLLQSNLTIYNVIEILVALDRFQSVKRDHLNTFDSRSINKPNGQTVNQLPSSIIANLINLESHLSSCIDQCYLIIDENGDNVLASESLVSVGENLLRSILTRDSLVVTNELTVFNCLDRWSSIQCVKRQKEVTIGNKVEILGNNIYLSRYLTMTLEVFKHGPYLSDLLSDKDKEIIVSKLYDGSVPLPVHLKQYRLDKPRKEKNFQKSPRFTNYHENQRSHNQLVKKSHRNLSFLVDRKSNLSFKKLLNGLGEAMICVIQLLD